MCDQPANQLRHIRQTTMKPHPPQPARDDTPPATYDVVVAARLAGVHEQTLRHYERLGLVTPARKGSSPRSPRRYTEDDIARVAHIRRLVKDLGVNLAGVETILNMRDHMEQLRRVYDAETRRLRNIIAELRSEESSDSAPD
ncbi:MAG: MerR family transcriptional regulator [Ktedonobacterales bacterium]